MIKNYSFNYDFHSASAEFSVDTTIFTEKQAQELLDFFSWNYDKKADPIDEMMKKYALSVIEVATFDDLNKIGVISHFQSKEGFLPLDGRLGIELLSVEEYVFDEEDLQMTIN